MNFKSPIGWLLFCVPMTLMVVGALVMTGVVDPCDPKHKKTFNDAIAKGKKLAKRARRDMQTTLSEMNSD